jgi:hypothetical protein
MTCDEVAILFERIIALRAAMEPIESEFNGITRKITGCGDESVRERLRSTWTPVIERLCDIALVADQVTTSECVQRSATCRPDQTLEALMAAFAGLGMAAAREGRAVGARDKSICPPTS